MDVITHTWIASRNEAGATNKCFRNLDICERCAFPLAEEGVMYLRNILRCARIDPPYGRVPVDPQPILCEHQQISKHVRGASVELECEQSRFETHISNIGMYGRPEKTALCLSNNSWAAANEFIIMRVRPGTTTLMTSPYMCCNGVSDYNLQKV